MRQFLPHTPPTNSLPLTLHKVQFPFLSFFFFDVFVALYFQTTYFSVETKIFSCTGHDPAQQLPCSLPLLRGFGKDTFRLGTSNAGICYTISPIASWQRTSFNCRLPMATFGTQYHPLQHCKGHFLVGGFRWQHQCLLHDIIHVAYS